MSQSPHTLVFVYGTLKRGHCNARFLRGQKFIGEARTSPRYRMVDCGGYPGLYRDDANGRSIHGEVWEVNDAAKAGLDELEDLESGLYTFEPIELLEPFTNLNPPIYAYFYALSPSSLPDAGDNWPLEY